MGAPEALGALLALGAALVFALLLVIALARLPSMKTFCVVVCWRPSANTSAGPSASSAPSASGAPTAALPDPSAGGSAPSANTSAAPSAGPTGRPGHHPHGPSGATASAAPEDLVRRALGRGLGRIQHCFDEHPGALTSEGTVQLRFTIDTAGAVTGADLSPAAPCVLGVVRGISFGAQASTITLRTQFTVRPVHQ